MAPRPLLRENVHLSPKTDSKWNYRDIAKKLLQFSKVFLPDYMVGVQQFRSIESNEQYWL